MYSEGLSYTNPSILRSSVFKSNKVQWLASTPLFEKHICIMGLLSNRTHWFFILPSSTEAEERHIHDIAFGVKILLYKDIDYNDISVIIDHAPGYAGIFNQMPLSTHLGLSKNPKCKMVAVGGTGLFSSVSAPLTVNNITFTGQNRLTEVPFINCLIGGRDVFCLYFWQGKC